MQFILNTIIYYYSGISDENIDLKIKNIFDKTKDDNIFYIQDCIFGKDAKDKITNFTKIRLPIIIKKGYLGILYGLKSLFVKQPIIDISIENFKDKLNKSFIGKRLPINNILDLSYYGNYKTLNNCYTVGTKAYFDNDLNLYQIEVNDEIITSIHKKWDIAKIFLLQNIFYYGLFYIHSLTQNMGPIFACSIKKLKVSSPIRILLQPHFTYTNSAENHDIFNIFYQHTNPANPLSFEIDMVFKIIGDSLNDDFKNGSIEKKFPKTEYYTELSKYYELFKNFTTFFVENNDVMNYDTKKWIDEIKKTIPYFPRGEDLSKEDLILILSKILFEMTIEHSTLYKFKTNSYLTRIRVPYENENISLKEINRKVDIFQQTVFATTFSDIFPDQRLLDLNYDSSINVNMEEFKNNLLELSKTSKFVDIQNVACSIDI